MFMRCMCGIAWTSDATTIFKGNIGKNSTKREEKTDQDEGTNSVCVG